MNRLEIEKKVRVLHELSMPEKIVRYMKRAEARRLADHEEADAKFVAKVQEMTALLAAGEVPADPAPDPAMGETETAAS